MAAPKKQPAEDPTISTESISGEEYPEGTHPAAAPDAQHFSVDRFEYRDNPDKPDPSSVAQVQVVPEDEQPAK